MQLIGRYQLLQFLADLLFLLFIRLFHAMHHVQQTASQAVTRVTPRCDLACKPLWVCRTNRTAFLTERRGIFNLSRSFLGLVSSRGPGGTSRLLYFVVFANTNFCTRFPVSTSPVYKFPCESDTIWCTQ
jgi:hypothetical protein